METLFQISNLLVMPFWLLIIALPHWSWTRRIVASPWIVAPAALLYAVLVLPGIGDLLPALMDASLDSIVAVLGTPAGAAIGWIHFLAFDLFVGRWVYLDSRERNITAWLVSPTLFFVLMFGPLGLLIYLIVRAVMHRVQA